MMNIILKVCSVHKLKEKFCTNVLLFVSLSQIVSGIVQFRFELGSGEGIVRVTSVAVNDGHWHEISLQRMGNTALLTIDKTHFAQGVAPGTSDILNTHPYLLYFGSEVSLL